MENNLANLPINHSIWSNSHVSRRNIDAKVTEDLNSINTSSNINGLKCPDRIGFNNGSPANDVGLINDGVSKVVYAKFNNGNAKNNIHSIIINDGDLIGDHTINHNKNVKGKGHEDGGKSWNHTIPVWNNDSMQENLKKQLFGVKGNNARSAMRRGSETQRDEERGKKNGQRVQSLYPAEGSRCRYFEKCVPLRHAALKGDWEVAKNLMDIDQSLCTESITENGETVLHIAAGAGKTHFIKKLLDLREIDNKALERPDGNSNTAFCFAVAAGAKSIAEKMLQKNPNLLTICGINDAMPLYYAALFGRGEMAIFLYDKMEEERKNIAYKDQEAIFFACLNTDLYVVAQKLLDANPDLAKARCTISDDTALHILARKPSTPGSTTASGILSGIFQRTNSTPTNGFQLANRLWNLLKLEINVKEIIRTPKHVLFDAIQYGNYPLLEMMMHSYPDLAWETNEKHQTIFHAAIRYRRADIFYLIYDTGSIKDVINSFMDDEGNNMLHLAARYPNQSRLDLIPGAALQMQQELLWYEEVEKIMEPSSFKRPNRAHPCKTPQELFREEHQKLLKDGEKWMKNMANSCTIVATIIATVVFATAFTMPGGNDQSNGSAIFLHKNSTPTPTFVKKNPLIFHIFSLSASIALAGATTSIFFFLSILISPYSQKEFITSLPLKMMIGFFSLLISVVAMMFAFSTSFILAYAENSKFIPWLIITVEILPIFLFSFLLGPLFYNVSCSTYIRKLLFQKRKLMLY